MEKLTAIWRSKQACHSVDTFSIVVLRNNFFYLDLKNSCDPSTNIGVFLLFPKFRKFCENKGLSDFGPFGAGTDFHSRNED